MKFLGFIEEEDGSLTLEAADENGAVHEFRGVTVTGFDEMKTASGHPIEMTSLPVHLVSTGSHEPNTRDIAQEAIHDLSRYAVLTGEDVEAV